MSPEERIDLIKSIFKNKPGIKVDLFNGLLVEYAKTKGIFTIIRGLRAVSDFDYEFQMALTNRQLVPKMDTIFLMTDSRYSYLSSSLVKQLGQFKASIKDFVPPVVEDLLKEKFS